MYWKQAQASPQIFAKEDLTLTELFDQEGLFEELKTPNKGLIEFITRNDILTELVKLVTEEPCQDLDEMVRYRLPNLACEVLTADNPLINEKLSNKDHLTRLYSFLESDPPLNPLLASFFSRTFSMLICRKHEQYWYSYQFTCLQVLDFLKSREHSLDLLIKHLGTSAIMELTLKVLTQIEGPDLRNTLIDLLESEHLLENLISLFDPSVDEDRHSNVADLLCETIYKSKEDLANNSGTVNPILDKIQSPMMVDLLLSHVFGEEVSQSSIVGGISVLLAVLCSPPSSDANKRYMSDAEWANHTKTVAQKEEKVISLLITPLVAYLPRLHQILINPPKRDPIKLACVEVDPPLGQERLSIVTLLVTLISLKNNDIISKIVELNTFQVVLDLFFQYRWNNFLHTQTEKLILAAMNAYESPVENPLIENMFIKCRLIERIMETWKENEKEQSIGGLRRGYMGHLISISNSILDARENLAHLCDGDSSNNAIPQKLNPKTLEDWREFTYTTLLSINEVQDRFLGGIHPSTIQTNSDESGLKNAYEVIQGPMIKMDDLNASMLEGDGDEMGLRNTSELIQDPMEDCMKMINEYSDSMEQNNSHRMFNQLCSKKSCTPFWRMAPDRMSDNLDDTASNSSDEEEKDEEPEADVWKEPVWNVSVEDPWGETSATSNQDEGWANFDSPNFIHSFAEVVQGLPSASFSPIPTTKPLPIPKPEVCPPGLMENDFEDCCPPQEFHWDDEEEEVQEYGPPAVDESKEQENKESSQSAKEEDSNVTATSSPPSAPPPPSSSSPSEPKAESSKDNVKEEVTPLQDEKKEILSVSKESEDKLPNSEEHKKEKEESGNTCVTEPSEPV